MDICLKNAKKMQKIYGFGTSACWWSHKCQDENTANKIAELLYGNSGLNLNIYRYNIGGGYDKDNCRVDNPWRNTESFYVFDKEEEKGEYDFSRDKYAVEMMKKCLAKGNIDTLILFANSPHYSQTSTGQASGSLLYHTCNIPKSKYKEFVDYFLTITEHFIDDGLPVKYISPINEPQWKWGGTSVWQEGCHYETEEIVEIFHIFAEEIIKRKLNIKLYGPESGEMNGKTEEYISALKKDKTIMSVMDIFAYHSYHADDDFEIRNWFKNDVVSKNGEFRFDMSEWCELPNKSHTKDFDGALITARIIGQDLIYAGASSWTSWVAVNQICEKEDGFDYSDGLITASNDFSSWYVAERYYALAHFSKFVPVGSVCLDIGYAPMDSKLNIFTFLTPSNETVLVIDNEGEDTDLDIIGDYDKMMVIESYQDNYLSKIYDGKFSNNLKIKSKSIETVVLL